MAQLCPFYGTPRGCRKGRKCDMLHVTPDGTTAVSKADPQTVTRHRDEFRTRLHSHFNEWLESRGAVATVSGMAFTRDAGPLKVRCVVANGMPVSQRTWDIINGVASESGLAGRGTSFARAAYHCFSMALR